MLNRLDSHRLSEINRCLSISDNWAKVSTQWKHRRGSAQLAQKRIAGEANLQQLAQKALPDPAWAQAFS